MFCYEACYSIRILLRQEIMNATLRNSIAALSILFVTLFIGVQEASAQTPGEGIEIKPAVIEDRANPGEVYEFTIKVTNISGSEKTFFLSAQDISGLTDSGLPIFSDETEITPYELSSWVKLPESSITLGANETRSIPFSITVPTDAAPGAHFGGVFLDARPPKQRVTGSAVGMKVGSIINLRIAGDVNEDAQLREFSSSHIVYGSAAKIDFTTKIANLGNVLLRPHGLIEITNMQGSKVGLAKINDTGAGVFPASDKSFVSTWEHDGFAFGRYQAVASVVYGEDGRKTISAAASFWVLPLKPILTVLGSVFTALLILYVLVRSYINRKIREMGGGRGGADLYARRNRSPVPRLLIIALALLFLAIVFLVILFLMFA